MNIKLNQFAIGMILLKYFSESYRIVTDKCWTFEKVTPAASTALTEQERWFAWDKKGRI